MPTPSDLLNINRPDSLQEVRALLDRARREGITYFPSPIDWRDEVLYFLLPDRFSDGNEASRSLLTRDEIRDFRRASSRPNWNWKAWADSGRRWQGGTIKGITGRGTIKGITGQLDYLQELGITTIWVGPVFKQRVRLDTYHGYGIQDFLEVDPRFGTRRNLIELVSAAHSKQMRIILDIIMNHSGDNWGYVPPEQLLSDVRNEPPYLQWPDYYGFMNHSGDNWGYLPPEQPLSDVRNEQPYLQWPDYYGNPNRSDGQNWRLAWRNEQEIGFTTNSEDIKEPHQGIWPRELQNSQLYTRAGKGDLGTGDINDPHAENKRTDFFSLKDFALDAPNALSFLADCFKYWIALTDCDGFRIDTVKHISLEQARSFCGAIREFTDTLGKRNFLLVGEIAGGDYFQDFFIDRLAILQRNLSAALDIGNARVTLNNVAKGLVPGPRIWRKNPLLSRDSG